MKTNLVSCNLICCKFYFVLSLCFFLQPATEICAQPVLIKVIGKIINDATKKPVSNVRVYSNNNREGVFCDEEGSFTIKVNKGDSLFFFIKGFYYQTSMAEKETANMVVALKPIWFTAGGADLYPKMRIVVIDGKIYPIDILSQKKFDIKHRGIMKNPNDESFIPVFETKMNLTSEAHNRFIFVDNDSIRLLDALKSKSYLFQ